MRLIATIQLPGGATATMPLSQADYYFREQLQATIVFGVHIGAAIVLSATLFMVARTYRSVLFALYQTNLALLVIHAALTLQNLESSMWSLSWYFTGIVDISDTTVNCTMTSGVIYWFLIITICSTLVVQVYASFANLPRRQRLMVLALAILAAFPCVFVWGFFLITGVHDALNANKANAGSEADRIAGWAMRGAWPVFAATTVLFSAVLCIKLALVIRTRARMGIDNFDPLRAVLTMTIQNSVIPAIVSIVCAAIPESEETNCLPSVIIALTVILLPTGYIWAQYRSLGTSRGAVSHATAPTSSLTAYLGRLRSSHSPPSDRESVFSEMPTPTTGSTLAPPEKAVDFLYPMKT